jgi:hypothetical protein
MLWQTGTGGHSGAICTMQVNGDLVVSLSGTKLWDTHTSGATGAYLVLQSNGDLVIYTSNGSRKVWDSGTESLARTLASLAAAKAAHLAAGKHIDDSAKSLIEAFAPIPRVDAAGPSIRGGYFGNGHVPAVGE